MERMESEDLFTMKISAAGVDERGFPARWGALVLDASQRLVSTRWEEPAEQRPLETFSLPLQGWESRFSLLTFASENEELISEILDRTAQGRWTEVHGLRDRLTQQWREMDLVSEAEFQQQVQWEMAFGLGAQGKLPDLESMEAFWNHDERQSAFAEGLDDSLHEAQDFNLLHSRYENLPPEKGSTRRRLEVLASVRESREALRESLFPEGKAISLADLHAQYPQIADQQGRLAARTWTLEVEMLGKKSPEVALEPHALASVRERVLDRLDVLTRHAEELRADHALAVQADRLTPGPVANGNRNQMEYYIREEQVAERLERLEQLAKTVLPEVLGEFEKPRSAIQDLARAMDAPREPERWDRWRLERSTSQGRDLERQEFEQEWEMGD